ncbi:MAG: hypothetical protein ACKVRN_13255 [Pyrinomonadaceae bacterium]
MQHPEFNTGVIKPMECVREAWALIKGDYWLLFAIWIVGVILSSISLLIAAGALTCGIFYAYLRKIDGHEVKFDDLWKGMNWFLPGLILMLIIAVPMFVVYGVIYVPIVLSAVMGSKLSQDELIALLIGAFAVELVLVLVMVCIHTLLIFSFPLIVDRNLGATKAITTSARAVLKNLSGVAGLLGLNFLLAIAGYIALCIGIYFVIPIIIAANVTAYRKVFPQLHQ